MKIIISPFSAVLPNNFPNAKNYPYWGRVVALLRDRGIYTIQVGVNGEDDIKCDEKRFNLRLKELKVLLDECDGFMAVDNFFQHFAKYYNRSGVVIWGKSDPLLFGYPTNLNILRDRKYLREQQFRWWRDEPMDLEAFELPEIVVESAIKFFDCQK